MWFQSTLMNANRTVSSCISTARVNTWLQYLYKKGWIDIKILPDADFYNEFLGQ